MDSFNQPQHQSPYQGGPNPPNPFANPHPNSQQIPVGAAPVSRARKGRSWFLGGLAAVVLAAGTGVGGYRMAEGMLGSDDIETVAPADGGTGGDQTGTGADPEVMTADDSMDGATPVPGAAMTVEQANASVVRIEATGEFADPEFGLIEGTGSGSGFIISPDGVAVTNNHVVAGAAFLEVYLPGEDGPRNARILATSECSDLAVIDIDGDGFPQVALNMNDPTIGTAVYAAGYPLGDPEFTLTKGIVSKEVTRSDTPFSSVDGVLEHDARINPGNSGGPLFDESGQVVGINYQGNPSTQQSFAITPANALPIIDQLRNGVSVDSIGINGQVVNLGDFFGIYVSSVETGSTADRVGIIPGDVILELENVPVSTDGTMGDYCDVLRTNGTDVPLNIDVFRPSTNQVLFGTLNGNALNVGFDGNEMMSDAGMTAPAPDEAAAPASYQRVTDETGTVSVEVPAAWNDVAAGPIGEGNSLPNVAASANLPGFVDGWTNGGIQLTAFDAATYDFQQVWQQRTTLTDNCNIVEEAEGADFGQYTGVTLVAHECGPEGAASLLLFQVESEGSANFASGIIQVLTVEDVAAAERALVTFGVS